MEGLLIPWVIAATLMLFVGAYWVYSLEKRIKVLEIRYKKILSLAEEADEVTMVQVLSRLELQEERLAGIEGVVHRLGDILPHTLQGYGVVRYSAFENVGGNQSFSMALVDERGNGAMLSGLHGRGDTRVYAKPLTQWRSPFSLSAEEQQALGKARQVTEGADVEVETPPDA